MSDGRPSSFPEYISLGPPRTLTCHKCGWKNIFDDVGDPAKVPDLYRCPTCGAEPT